MREIIFHIKDLIWHSAPFAVWFLVWIEVRPEDVRGPPTTHGLHTISNGNWAAKKDFWYKIVLDGIILLIFFFFLPFWALRCYMRLWPDIALPGDPLLVKKADRGALVVAQWWWMWLVFMRLWVRSLAWISGLRIRHCHELQCRSQTQLGSAVAMAVA